MRLTFLGTSSGTPTRERNVSGLALRHDSGACWIIDCGEGTQHRLLATDLRPGRIDLILLTHLHGDHCYGLPGLVASIAVHDRGRDPVTIVGPRGLAAWWQATRRATHLGLSFPVRIVEVPTEGGKLGRWDGCTVTALPLAHRVPCYGYLIEEDQRPGRFDAAKAQALGIEGRDRGRLAAGDSIVIAGLQVEAHELIGPPRPGRRLALLGDTADATPIADACAGSDLALHECTYTADRQDHANRWGHSTTTQVAAFAHRCRPRQLAINHFSSRYTMPDAEPGVAQLVAEIATQCPDQRIIAADDFLHLTVPFPEQPLPSLPLEAIAHEPSG